MSTAVGQAISGAGSRLAATEVGQLATRALSSRAGRCLTSVGTDLAVGLATAAHSFDPRTKVLMASGALIAISDLKVGDKVTATDTTTTTTGQTSAQPVTAVHLNLDRDLVDVTVRVGSPATDTEQRGQGDGDRSTRGPTATLHTTATHPFWDATARRWVNPPSSSHTSQTSLARTVDSYPWSP
jgi:hypothetical protein